jgi:pimeloyl-ACP methyl ester carboxylesterase
MVATDWLDFVGALMQQAVACGGSLPAFLLFDYPGYGANHGKPTPSSVLRGALAALHAAEPLLSAPPGKLHLLGHSLGAAAMVQLAAAWSRKDTQSLAPGTLLLSAPFVSIVGMAQAMAAKIANGLSPPAWLLRPWVAHKWDNLVLLPSAAARGWKTSIIHGTDDEIVPVAMGQQLRKALERANHGCHFVQADESGHNDLLYMSFSEYVKLMELTPQQAAL